MDPNRSPAHPGSPYDGDFAFSASEGQGSGFDMRSIFATILRHKWKILLSVLTALMLAWFYLASLIPLYTSRAEIVIEGQQTPVDLGEVLGSRSGSQGLRNELLIIQSRPLMAKVITDLDLMSDIEFNPTAGMPPQPSWSRWLEERGLWPNTIDFGSFPPSIETGVPRPLPEVRRDETILRIAIDRLRGKVSAGVIPDTTILRITTQAWTPQKAALISNAVAKTYIDERVRARVQAQKDASQFIADQVVELRKEVETAEAAIQVFRSENGVVNTGDATVVAYESVRNRAKAAAALEKTFRERLERYELTLASGEGIQAAARTLNDSRLTALANAGLDARLRDEVDVAVTQLKTDLLLAKGRAEALARSSESTESSLKDGAANLVRLRQLEREAEASKLLFETFLARQKETAVQQQLISSDARILNPALPPYGPSTPNRQKFYLLALALGLLFSGAIIFLLERTRHRFMTAEELETWGGHAVLGSVPKLLRVRRRSEILERVRRKPGSSVAEAVRNLRTSILMANIDEAPKLVVVTSSVPEEGKSLTTALLAMVTAQMGLKALIVDTDLRRRTLHRIIKVKPEPGLIALLKGTATFEEAIRVDEKSGMHAITVERNRLSPPDLLSSVAFRTFTEEAKTRYDLILFDAPPVLPVADARILGKMADALVYVVKWNHTPKPVVQNGLDILKNSRIPVTGLILTQVDRRKQQKSGYGYYGYGNYKYYSN